MYNSSNFRGQSRGPFRARRVKTIHHSLLVKKADPQVKEEAYVPKNTFDQLSLLNMLKNNIIKRGYTTPTPIQDQTIPHILEGRDVVGIANTGTGKTAAFLIPILNDLIQNRDKKALIIAPTRELAAQIKKELIDTATGIQLTAILCIGGDSIYRQSDALRRMHQVVIGTPGRLKDLAQNRRIIFSEFSTIVLDEVDRMLDMGFVHDIRFITSRLAKPRQSLFFSATLSQGVKEIMQDFLSDPVMISVKSQETTVNVDQDIVKLNGRNRIDVLHELLNLEEVKKTIVFGRTKHGVEKLSYQLYKRGFAVSSLHGNKSQSQRRQALEQFKSNKINVLLATDVAARGLDIPGVTHVINYELPETYDDYVHRIGRTGRANTKGFALSLVD